MVTKNKEDWLTVRIGASLKEDIRKAVETSDYPNMSAWLVAAIKEKLDPSKRAEITKKELLALREHDPGFESHPSHHYKNIFSIQ